VGADEFGHQRGDRVRVDGFTPSGGAAVPRWRRRCGRRGRAARQAGYTRLPTGRDQRGREGWSTVVLLSSGPCGRWTSGGRPVARSGSLRCDDQRCDAATGLPGCLPLRLWRVWLQHRDRAPGDSTSPASHGHPALRESLMALMREAYQLSSSQHSGYQAGYATR
jgi:hypothetical protein